MRVRLGCLLHQLGNVVSFAKGFVLSLQPCFDGFLRGLLAVVNGDVQGRLVRRREEARGSQVVAGPRIQSRTSSNANSSIELAPVV